MMTILKAPVSDLLQYMFDYESQDVLLQRCETLLHIIAKYYKIITSKILPIIPKTTLEDWCQGNWGNISAPPKDVGLLLRNSKDEFGLTAYDDDGQMVVFYMAGYVLMHKPLVLTEWEQYGYLSTYFFYPPEVENVEDVGVLGERQLQLGSTGWDVLMLQKLLRLNDFDVDYTAIFDEKTRAAIITAQKAYAFIPSGIVLANSPLYKILGW